MLLYLLRQLHVHVSILKRIYCITVLHYRIADSTLHAQLLILSYNVAIELCIKYDCVIRFCNTKYDCIILCNRHDYDDIIQLCWGEMNNIPYKY